MYCSYCGNPVDGSAFCPGCGQPVRPVAMPASPLPRVSRHLRTLGILWVVYAAYLLLHWLFVLPFLRAWAGGATWVEGANAWVYAPFHPTGWLLHLIAVIVVTRFILSLLVGWALLTRQPWGRVYAIVIAILTLIKPLWGTLLGIYTLWVLLGREAEPEYASLAQSHPKPPL